MYFKREPLGIIRVTTAAGRELRSELATVAETTRAVWRLIRTERERHAHAGVITVIARLAEPDERGAVLDVARIHNTVSNDFHNLERDMLAGAVMDAKVRYLGVGTDATAPGAAQHHLFAEGFRKAVAKWDTTPGTGILTTTTTVAGNEAVFNIQELAWFASPSATVTTDSGVMLARVLYSRNKTNLEALQVVRTDTYS